MSYADFGLDVVKKSKDKDHTVANWLCLWCSQEAHSGFGLCFCNWVMCPKCVEAANDSCNAGRWEKADECFKCHKKEVPGIRNDASWDSSFYLCQECITWAKQVLSPNINTDLMARKTATPAAPETPASTDAFQIEIPPSHLDRNQEREIEYLNLVDIFASPTNPRKHFDEAKLTELGNSIRKYGVIQPITVRPKKGMAGKFEIVCGECRWKASGIVERLTIPAICRDLSDDEVLDIQFAENLERQDVHAMDEAVTFRLMLDTERYTIPDIAAKVNKGQDFVVQRLSLNSLIPKFQGDFWAGKFLIGHAVQFSRLTVPDQKELHKRWGGKNDEYETLAEVKNYIDTNIIRKLSSAPFKKDDAMLVPAAGACNSCSKRSGANGVLFADYKDDDRCFDQCCFEKKMAAHLINKVQVTLENKPEIKLVEYGYQDAKVDPAIKKMAAKMNVEILDYSSRQVQSHQERGYIPIKVLMVSGRETGQVKTMYIKGKAEPTSKDGQPVKRTASAIDMEIKGIQARQERALELDGEKIWSQVEELLDKPATLELVHWNSEDPTQDERNAIAWALLNEIKDSDYEDAAWKALGLKGDHPGYVDKEDAEKIDKATNAQIFHLLRLFSLEKLKKGLSVESLGPLMLMPVLKSPHYLLSKIYEVERAQKTVTDKRIANAAKRIEKLNIEKASLQPKAKKVAPAKAGKLSKTVKALVDKAPDSESIVEHDVLEGDD